MKSKLTILILFFFLSSGLLFAQNPPHPNGGNEPGSGNTPVGGAPLAGGLLILTALGVGYSISKVYRLRRQYQDLME